MVSATDVLSFIVVGAFWGCTNPLLRKGSVESKEGQKEGTATTVQSTTESKNDSGSSRAGADAIDHDTNNHDSPATPAAKATTTSDNDNLVVRVYKSLLSLGNVRVWLPYALNQVGSILFNVLLANHDLSMTVPVCNGLALVFSVVTSLAIGERVNKPGRAIVGSTLVIVGLGICMYADNVAKQGVASDNSFVEDLDKEMESDANVDTIRANGGLASSEL